MDLAVVVTPAQTIPGVIRDCGEMGVRGAVVISAGFKELGAPGIELERQLLEEARRADIRIIGPNCLGLMSPPTGINATFAAGMARPGNVGFISQSGALCTAVLDWSFRELVGFSAFISVGSMLDVNWGDLIDYLGNDPRTRSILIYMESIGDARSFLSAAREVALTKPIIVIKARPHGCRRQGCRFAHRVAYRQRRRSRCCLPAQRRSSCKQYRGPVLHGRSAGQAASSARPAPHYSSPTPAAPASWPPTP